ncbi:MAG TPA: hypothetical protein VN679_05505, partial [Candidatus Acidoferrales bacterium]|nr:hypothetical protein [Candidatus Acidoferrales bacterium]
TLKYVFSGAEVSKKKWGACSVRRLLQKRVSFRMFIACKVLQVFENERSKMNISAVIDCGEDALNFPRNAAHRQPRKVEDQDNC